MKKIAAYLVIPLLLSACNVETKKEPITVNYPNTMKADSLDSYFGTEIRDPYRWLEDDRSSETETWVKEQNKTTFGFLEKIPFKGFINTALLKYAVLPSAVTATGSS